MKEAPGGDRPAPLLFGDFRFDPGSLELSRDGRPVTLRHQAAQLLALLASRAGTLVSREEIRDALWPDGTVVDFDTSINTRVRQIRLALEDDAETPRYLQTVPRLGYRFLPAVEKAPEGDLVRRESPRPRLGARFAALTLSLALVLATVVLWPRDPPPIDSLAVLFLENDTGDPELDYLGDGITESLINRFAQLRSIRVVSRGIVVGYRGQGADPMELGRALDVRAVLVGRLVRRGGTLLVAAELVDVEGRRQLWGGQYALGKGDVLSVQAELAGEIVNRLRAELTPDERERIERRETRNPEAFDAYIKGLHHFNRVDFPGLHEAAAFFQRAVEHDPGYALPHLGLANVYSTLGYHGMAPPREIWPQVKAEAERALRLDPDLPGAHAALGHAVLFADWDWPGAKRSLDRALKLDPDYAPTHHWYAHYWLAVGEPERALAASRRAVELEPRDMLLRGHEFYFLAATRHGDELSERCPQAAELEAHHWLIATCEAYADWLHGRLPQAIAGFELAAELSGGGSLPLTDLGVAYAAAGRREDAERVIADLEERVDRQGYTVSVKIAQIRGTLGDMDEAFEWLEKGYVEHDPSLLWLKVEAFPWYSKLSTDPRYDDLVRRVGFP